MTAKKKQTLNKKQLTLIDALFSSGMTESQALSRNKVRRSTYRRWLVDQVFIEELNFRVESAQLQSELILARYSPFAAAKLLELTESEKEETARKACLDIIELSAKKVRKKPENDNSQGTGLPQKFRPEVAKKLLEVLARENWGQNQTVNK